MAIPPAPLLLYHHHTALATIPALMQAIKLLAFNIGAFVIREEENVVGLCIINIRIHME